MECFFFASFESWWSDGWCDCSVGSKSFQLSCLRIGLVLLLCGCEHFRVEYWDVRDVVVVALSYSVLKMSQKLGSCTEFHVTA